MPVAGIIENLRGTLQNNALAGHLENDQTHAAEYATNLSKILAIITRVTAQDSGQDAQTLQADPVALHKELMTMAQFLEGRLTDMEENKPKGLRKLWNSSFDAAIESVNRNLARSAAIDQGLKNALAPFGTGIDAYRIPQRASRGSIKIFSISGVMVVLAFIATIQEYGFLITLAGFLAGSAVSGLVFMGFASLFLIVIPKFWAFLTKTFRGEGRQRRAPGLARQSPPSPRLAGLALVLALGLMASSQVQAGGAAAVTNGASLMAQVARQLVLAGAAAGSYGYDQTQTGYESGLIDGAYAAQEQHPSEFLEGVKQGIEELRGREADLRGDEMLTLIHLIKMLGFPGDFGDSLAKELAETEVGQSAVGGYLVIEEWQIETALRVARIYEENNGFFLIMATPGLKTLVQNQLGGYKSPASSRYLPRPYTNASVSA